MKIRKIFESESTDKLYKFINACEFIGQNIDILEDEFNHIDDLFLGVVEKYHLETVKTLSKENLNIGIQLVNPDPNSSSCFYPTTWKNVKSDFVPELFSVMERIYDRYPIMTFRIYLGGDDMETLYIRKSINNKKNEFFNLKDKIMGGKYFQTIMINITFDVLLKNHHTFAYK